MIWAETLGPVRVTIDGAPSPAELLWRKHLGLLVYLARSPKLRRTRAHLIGLLWPDKDEPSARHSLNEALRVIRRATGDQLTSDAEQVALHEGAVVLDVDLLTRSLANGSWEEASGLVLGEFLEGFELAGASEFETWLEAERSEWRRHGTAALVRWAESLAAEGRVAESLVAAERAARLDPMSESAVRQVMTAQSLAGEGAEAIARFEAFTALVGEELGIGPSGELRLLADRIKGRRLGGPNRPAPVANPLRRPPLVGRGTELGALLESWRRSRTAPRAEVVVVIGPQGAGRSRLLEEAARRVELDGAVVLQIRAVPADRVEPWNGLICLAAGLVSAPGVAGSPPEAIAGLAAVATEWAERFPSPMSGERWSVARAFAEVVKTVAAERPIAVLVDDAQWLDEESLQGLAAVIRSGPAAGVWMVFSASAEHGREGLDLVASQVGRDVPGELIHLGPLGVEGIAELVRWAFPLYGPTDAARMGRRLATDSAGIPLLVVELAAAVAQGMRPGAAAWPTPFRTLEDTMPGDLPDQLLAAFRVSFRRLGQPAQAALAAAAVLGERASLERIAAVAELPLEGAERAVDELEWTRWLESEPRGYAFVARIAREVVVRDMVTPGRRRRLEAKVRES